MRLKASYSFSLHCGYEHGISRKTFVFARSRQKGSQDCSESSALYSKRHSFNEKVMKFCFAYAIWVDFSVHLVPAICPIVYQCFGVPSHNYWRLAMSTDEM